MDVNAPDIETDGDDYEYVLVPFSRKAITAFVCGILAVLSGPGGFLFGVPAVILGYLAQRETRDGDLRGRPLAGWGLVLGVLGSLAGIALIINAL